MLRVLQLLMLYGTHSFFHDEKLHVGPVHNRNGDNEVHSRCEVVPVPPEPSIRTSPCVKCSVPTETYSVWKSFDWLLLIVFLPTKSCGRHADVLRMHGKPVLHVRKPLHTQ